MTETQEKLKSLFHPGAGRIPPHLTGRKQEQDFFHDCVARLLDRTSPDQDMIIYGPRGNGKTAMLRYLQKETLEKTGKRLDIAWVTPRKLKTVDELARAISGKDRKILEKVKSLGLSASIGIASLNAELDISRAAAVTEDLLQEKSRKTPLVLIMDEAHNLTPDMAGILLDASQNVRGEGCPFFLVMAGTPNLETTLQRSSATFWDKSNVFPLGRLSVEDARQALTIPLNSCQVACAQEVAEEIALRAYSYPYFIQIWGDCIASQLVAAGSRELTMDIVLEAEHTAIAKCTTVYRQRYNELNKIGLIALATDIAIAFDEFSDQYMPVQELEKLVRLSFQQQGLPVTHEAVQGDLQKLSHIGYIWEIAVSSEVEGEDPMLCYEPGIPSLMRFVRRQAPP